MAAPTAAAKVDETFDHAKIITLLGYLIDYLTDLETEIATDASISISTTITDYVAKT
jgi:hypothetical protein